MISRSIFVSTNGNKALTLNYLTMKNSSKKSETAKAKKNAQRIVGEVTIPASWGKELSIFKDVVNANRGKRTTFQALYAQALTLRTDNKYGLKAINDLASGTAKNFENRLARYLGGTKETALTRKSKQGAYFNIEVQSNQRVTFNPPIDVSRNLSPQVKGYESFKLPNRNLVQAKANISVEDIEA